MVATVENGPDPPMVSAVVSSPPAGSPTAKCLRTQAAARRGGQPQLPMPELSRAAALASPCELNISVGEEPGTGREEPPPPSPSTEDGNGTVVWDLHDDFFTSAVA